MSASLDGAPIESGTQVRLYELGLGRHTLTVAATDKAGNTAAKAVDFSVTTSFDDVAALLERFRAGGQLGEGAAEALTAQVRRLSGTRTVTGRNARFARWSSL